MMVHVTGGGGDVEAAFRDVAVVVRERFHTNRHMGCALEGRATLAKFDADGDITLWSSNQMPHMLRTRVADIMGFPEHKLRVIAPDVGGGFGPKAFVYPIFREFQAPTWGAPPRPVKPGRLHGPDSVPIFRPLSDHRR